MNNWRKYTFVCDPNECDSLLELTVKDGEFKFPNGVAEITCPCGRQMQCTSANLVQEEKEEAPMETVQYLKDQIKILQNNLANHSNCDYWKNENGRLQSQIIDIIDELYAGEWTDADDIANSLCQIIDYNPVKTIEFTATMNFTGRIDVPVREAETFDLQDILSDAYVDINHGDVVIDSYDLYDANEC